MYQFHPIGIVHSPFTTAHGSPLQPRWSKADGTLEIFDLYAEALTDIEGFDRLWMLFWCHAAKATSLIVTPYRDTRSHGVFATRSPARPNPIGLSCVRLLRRDGNILHVSQIDALDGSPLLDIKPYIPNYDVYDVSRCGWLDDSPSTSVITGDTRFET